MPVTNVKSAWVGGNLLFYDSSGTEFAQYDATNGMLRGQGLVRHIRSRFTVAQINAGATILAAVAGYKYRVLDMAMIAIGGNVGGSTTIDILATQSTSSVKLMAAAIAALTQSALLRAGASNATILADGASFVQNDANTAITISKTGGSATTATAVDVLLSYALEL
jgi:hypothetical protein